MKLTPKVIRNLIEDFTGLDLSVKTRQRPYVNAKAVYSKLCSDHLRFSATIEEIGQEIGLQHGDICYHANTAFRERLKNDTFAEFYIEMSNQVNALKEINKKTRPIIQAEIDPSDKLEALQQKLIESEIKYQRLKDDAKKEWIGEILEMSEDQLNYLEERIKPAIIRTKTDVK